MVSFPKCVCARSIRWHNVCFEGLEGLNDSRDVFSVTYPPLAPPRHLVLTPQTVMIFPNLYIPIPKPARPANFLTKSISQVPQHPPLGSSLRSVVLTKARIGNALFVGGVGRLRLKWVVDVAIRDWYESLRSCTGRS